MTPWGAVVKEFRAAHCGFRGDVFVVIVTGDATWNNTARQTKQTGRDEVCDWNLFLYPPQQGMLVKQSSPHDPVLEGNNTTTTITLHMVCERVCVCVQPVCVRVWGPCFECMTFKDWLLFIHAVPRGSTPDFTPASFWLKGAYKCAKRLRTGRGSEGCKYMSLYIDTIW